MNLKEKLIKLEAENGGKVVIPRDNGNQGRMIGNDRMAADAHDYAGFYAKHLKNKSFKTVMEIGILAGTGLSMWSKLYPDARIYGCDIRHDLIQVELPTNVSLHIVDQTTVRATDIKNIISSKKLDLVIDDAMHEPKPLENTFIAIEPFLSKDFLYILEDLNAKSMGTPYNPTKSKLFSKYAIDYDAERGIAAITRKL